MSAERPTSLQTATGRVPRKLPITAGLVTLLLLLPALLYPLARDQWTFAFMGRALLMGETLYRDAWDVKPPPIYLIYSLILAVSGMEPEQVRIGVLVAALMPASAAGYMLARLAGRWIGDWAGLPAAALWTLLYLHGGRGGRLIGLIAIADAVRPTSKATIAKLQERGVKVAMITGDNQATAERIGKELGIDIVLADVLPGQKASKIKELQAQGHKVAMVGDGINDAPALTQADVGFAIGAGTDVAMESAQVVLMKSDPYDVVGAIELSRATLRKMHQNLW